MKRDLVTKTAELISSVVGRAGNPAVFTSFGKDSMVLLGLLRQTGLLEKTQVVTFRHPSFPKRYHQADEVIRDWSLDPLIVLHGWNSVLTGGGRVDLVGTAATRNCKIHLPVANIVPPDYDAPWSCALDNQLPAGMDLIRFDFDLVVIGSKQCDTDPTVGQVLVPNTFEEYHGETAVLYPIREWSDSDVWQFIQQNAIQYDESRYMPSSTGEMVDNVEYENHPEYLPVCTACVHPGNRGSVFCPKLRRHISPNNTGIAHELYPPLRRSSLPEVVAL